MAFSRPLLQLGVLSGLCLGAGLAAAQTTAFYYAGDVPRELWLAYDQVVVEPGHVPNPSAIRPRRAEPVAYFSVGEVASGSREAPSLPSSWILARSPQWSSWVMDVGAPGYQAHLLERFEALWSAGYRRFFLDTLDSYRLGAKSEEANRRARAGLVKLISGFAARHPEARILLNRGFELLPELAPLVHGVVAESLFDRWDAANQKYTRVPESDRSWLLARLLEVRERYHLPVTVIDYRPADERAAARSTARQIQALGFEPWVTDGALGSVGVGSVEVLPRRVLLLTNEAAPSAEELATEARASEPDALRLLAPVLEYLGYIPEHHSLSAGLPKAPLLGRYQGVITWLSSSEVPSGYAAWLERQIQAGVRLAMFGAPGFELDSSFARGLGIRVRESASAGPVHVTLRDELVGFEAEPAGRPLDVPPLTLEGPGVVPHLRLANARGTEGTAVATTAFGGLALSHVFAARGLEGERAWVIDPFAFLERALGLPLAPQPDVTTEQGRRVAMWVIRARGLSDPTRLSGRPSTLRVLTEHLLLPRRWPHTLDVSGTTSPPPTEADLAAAKELLRWPFIVAGELQPGLTDARELGASLTRVSGMARWDHTTPEALPEISGPIATALRYLPANSPEAYPYARVQDTLEYTDTPRRLKPVLLDYPAFVAGSPGGVATLEKLYAWLDDEGVFPLGLGEYVERVAGFRDQVLLLHLDGSFSVRGGEALATLRVPAGLGPIDLSASQGVASVRQLRQGRYVSFTAGGERHLVFAPNAPNLPHLVQSNGVVESFTTSRTGAGFQFALRIHGHVPLSFELAGLARGVRCELAGNGFSSAARVDPRGLLSIELHQQDTGSAVLRCPATEARP